MLLKRTILCAALAASLAPAFAEGELNTYRVQPGEGLNAVARRFHTDRRTLESINRLSGGRLSAGQVLFIPAAPKSGAEKPVAPPAIAPAKPTAARPAPRAIRAQPARAAARPASRPAPAPKPALKPAPAVRAAAPAVRPTPARTAVKKPAPTATTFLPDYQDPKREPDMPLGRVIFDLAWKLAVVLGIAYGSIWMLRGILQRPGVMPGRKGHLKVLESASLGPNRSIHLVKVGGKVLVVGSTNDQITAIGEVDDPETLSDLAKDAPRAFAEHLSAAESGEAAPLAEQVQGGIRHLWGQVQEIRGLRPRGDRK